MKRNVIYSLLISTAILTGCDHRQPASSSSPSSLTNSANPASPAAAATHTGPIDLSAEIARAKVERKLVFLDFTGSDWCPPCIAFHEKVFSQPEFIAYAKTNLIFLEVDFPRRNELPPAIQATNKFLAEKFEIMPLPTLILLNGDGNEIWRLPAKDDPNPSIPPVIFSPQGFIAMLEEIKKKQP